MHFVILKCSLQRFFPFLCARPSLGGPWVAVLCFMEQGITCTALLNNIR